MSQRISRRKSPKKKVDPYLKVFKLELPSTKWKFRGGFPKDVLEEKDPKLHVQGKIWWIKQHIRMHTRFNNKIQSITGRYVHPEGFCVLPPLATSRMFNNVYDNLTELFNTEFPPPLPEYKQFEVEAYHYQETMRYLRENQYNSLSNLIKRYLKFLCTIYNVAYSNEFLNEHINVGFLRYEIGAGLGLHIDNIADYDQGPIITISIGPEFVYYDMTPTLLNDHRAFPLRFCATQGSIMIMDGSSRMEWAHALPYKVPSLENKQKYTIFFKCHKFRRIHPRYNKILNAKITSSGIVC